MLLGTFQRGTYETNVRPCSRLVSTRATPALPFKRR